MYHHPEESAIKSLMTSKLKIIFSKVAFFDGGTPVKAQANVTPRLANLKQILCFTIFDGVIITPTNSL